MTSPAEKKIFDEALSLPSESREALVVALAESLDPVELSPAWEAEIVRRLERLASGEARILDAEEHLRELRAKFA